MAEDYSEALFQSVDTIVAERIKNLPYDRTIRAKICDNSKAFYGLYRVTTDNVNKFMAYSEDTSYNINDEVYVRIPEGDYRKQKVILGRYIPEVTINQTPTGGQVFYQARPGNIPFVSYKTQDGKSGYLVSDTVRLGSYQLLLYSNPSESTTYSPDETNSKSYEVQAVLVHYISENGILYADEITDIPNCWYGIDDGTTSGLEYNKILDGQYNITQLTKVSEEDKDGVFYVNFTPTHQIIHPYAIAQAYAILSSGAIVVSDPIIFNANEQLSSKYRSFTLEVNKDQFFNYNARGRLIETNNLNCTVEITYDNILDNSAEFDTEHDSISIIGRELFQDENEQISFNGKKATILLSVDPNQTLETSFHVEHLVFNIMKDNVSYSISKDFYFGYKQIDANTQTNTINLYLNENDILKYYKLSVGDDGALIDISSSGVNLGGKSLSDTGTWEGTAAVATGLANAPSFTINGNQIQITAGGKTSAAITVPYATNATTAAKLDTNAGSLTTPVYFSNGVPAVITSLNETLLGFNANNSNFSTAGKETKLYAWLKAIQTNVNTLAAEHSGITLNWPATL